MSVRVTIHSTGSGPCSLTGKDGTEGLTVTFEDGTVKESFLSWKSFRQLLGLKAGQAKQEPKPTGPPSGAIPATVK